jgi:hypothetical protein
MPAESTGKKASLFQRRLDAIGRIDPGGHRESQSIRGKSESGGYLVVDLLEYS